MFIPQGLKAVVQVSVASAGNASVGGVRQCYWEQDRVFLQTTLFEGNAKVYHSTHSCVIWFPPTYVPIDTLDSMYTTHMIIRIFNSKSILWPWTTQCCSNDSLLLLWEQYSIPVLGHSLNTCSIEDTVSRVSNHNNMEPDDMYIATQSSSTWNGLLMHENKCGCVIQAHHRCHSWH